MRARAAVVASIALLSLLGAARGDDECEFSGANGAFYDLKSISGGYYSRVVGAARYTTSICSTVSNSTDPCVAQGSSGFAFSKATGSTTCTVLASPSASRTFELLDASAPKAGLQVKYSGAGDRCTSVTGYTVLQSFSCSESVEHVSFDGASVDGCTVTFSFTSSAACPTYPGLSIGWWIIIISSSAAAIYLAAGSVIKWRLRGASGIEAVPHIEFWRAFFANARLGCAVTWAAITCAGRRGAGGVGAGARRGAGAGSGSAAAYHRHTDADGEEGMGALAQPLDLGSVEVTHGDDDGDEETL